MNLQFTNDNILSKSMVFVGQKAKKIIQPSKLGDEVVTEFLTHVVTAYKTCSQYAQTKLRLSNQTLKSAAIDPEFILSQKVGDLNHLLGLPDLLAHMLDGDEEHEGCDREVRKCMQGNNLPACKSPNDNEVDVVQWWSSISTKYPWVYKMVMSALSIFCAPKVKSSFNIMSDTNDKKSNRMKVKTFNVI